MFEEGLRGATGGLSYEVPGEDIIARMEERAAMADVVVADYAKHKDPCSKGIAEQAKTDAAQLRLCAKYLDPEKTYTLGPGTLREIFVTEPHYVSNMREAAPDTAKAERRW